MAINPIQNIAVEKGTIISAASDMLFFLENSIDNNPIYDTVNKLNEISNFSDLYNRHDLVSLNGFLEGALSDDFNIKRGEIIKGQNTFNWIDYCYRRASAIRWCRFLYKNPNYLNDNIGFNPEDISNSEERIYALSLEAFVFLSSSTYTSAIVEANNLSETGWQKCGGGISSQIDFVSNDKLSSNIKVNESDFAVGTLIEASDINDTISKYNSILDLTKTAKDLSCEFCDGKDQYEYFYGGDSEDDLTNTVPVKFILFSNANNLKYVYDVFNFTGSYNNISDNGKTILNNNDSWTRLANKLYSGSLYVGQSNWDNHKLFTNFSFSLADLGIIGIKVDNFTFNGWHIIRTDENLCALSDATSLLNSTDKTKHFYFEYGNKTDFNSIKNVQIGVNLSQPNSRYWIIPDISTTISSTTLAYLNHSSATPKNSADSQRSKNGDLYRIPNDAASWGVGFNTSSNGRIRYDNSTKYYGILEQTTTKFWKVITDLNEHNDFIRNNNNNYYPMSTLTQITYGIDIAVKGTNYSETKDLGNVYLSVIAYGTQNNYLTNTRIKDHVVVAPDDLGNFRVDSDATGTFNIPVNTSYIKYKHTYPSDSGFSFESDGQYGIGAGIYKKRITKNIKL